MSDYEFEVEPGEIEHALSNEPTVPLGQIKLSVRRELLAGREYSAYNHAAEWGFDVKIYGDSRYGVFELTPLV